MEELIVFLLKCSIVVIFFMVWLYIAMKDLLKDIEKIEKEKKNKEI